MARRRRRDLYPDIAVRAMEYALHERLIDRCWDELREVFERPDVRQAEALIIRAIAEQFAPDRREKRGRGGESGFHRDPRSNFEIPLPEVVGPGECPLHR